MATIEERARAYVNSIYTEKPIDGLLLASVFGYQKGACEQDRIAREEERERCIEVAQEMLCKVHLCGTRITHCNKVNTCGWLKELRNLMERDKA